MKICPHCNQEILDTALKCIHCGEWVEALPAGDVKVPGQQILRMPSLEYFSISPLKIGLLSALTFGVYDFYWFYRQWKAIHKQQVTAGIIPVFRAVLNLIFCYSLFKRVIQSADKEGFSSSLPGGVWAFFYIVLKLSIILSIFGFIPLVFIQQAVQFNNRIVNPLIEENKNFSLWEILVMIPGGILLLALLVGIFLPE